MELNCAYFLKFGQPAALRGKVERYCQKLNIILSANS